MNKQHDTVKMMFRDWKRLPRAFRAVIEGQPQVLLTRTGRSYYAPVEFVG
ncbi:MULTISPECIES: hypothetical protein [Vogesella]|jgi:hypothetical protein|nr:hypothetical protein [Vogesella urethralis]MEC5207278.1 hypothetical protein [Vogesella perlucida]